MHVLVIDRAALSTRDAFWDSVLPQSGAPAWHGRNLDALRDSWISGGVCERGPPFEFRFRGACSRGFRAAVLSVAKQSVRARGGRIVCEPRPRSVSPPT